MPRKSSRALWADYLQGEGSKPKEKPTSPSSSPVPRGFSGTILGLDPSLRGTGFAIVTHNQGTLRIVACDTIKIPSRRSLYECLAAIDETIETVLSRYPVDHVACERTIYVQNVQTATTLGSARAAALLPPARRRLPIYEYSPLRIKQAIVGRGRASKEQVNQMVSTLLGNEQARGLDESDAAAAAICHAFTHRGEPG